MVAGRISQDSNEQYTLNLNNDGIMFTIEQHNGMDSALLLMKYKSHTYNLFNSNVSNTDLKYGKDPLT